MQNFVCVASDANEAFARNRGKTQQSPAKTRPDVCVCAATVPVSWSIAGIEITRKIVQTLAGELFVRLVRARRTENISGK
jgi:hypothetical protein